MKQPIVKAALVGGLILFAWMMFSWMALPWHRMTMHHFSNESMMRDALRSSAPASGVYVMPNMMHQTTPEGRDKAAMEMMHGPFVFMNVMATGANPNSPWNYIVSLLADIVAVGVVAWLLLQTKGLSYAGQVAFVTLAGVTSGLLEHVQAWNWWHMPLGYTIVEIFDVTIGWLLVGFVVPKLLKK